MVEDLTDGIHWSTLSYPEWARGGVSPTDSVPIGPPGIGAPSAPPASIAEIAKVINEARAALGFQPDAAVNAFELLMNQLESRASRTSATTALRTLHADYIGGPQANYRKWYFASKMDLLDKYHQMVENENQADHRSEQSRAQLIYSLEAEIPLSMSEELYSIRMAALTDLTRLTDLCVYLLCWTEANQVRYMPECLAFLYKSARDYIDSPQALGLERVAPSFFLDNIITPLYNCYRGYNFAFTSKGYVRRAQDHSSTIGYDDMNELFWHLAGIEKLRVDKIRTILDIPKDLRYVYLAQLDWSNCFEKTYRESRTVLHIVTNFSRTWIIHLCTFWFFTVANSPWIFEGHYDPKIDNPPQLHVRLSLAALGGILGPAVTFLALIGEAMFVPRTSQGGVSSVKVRLVFCAALLFLNAAPSMYILPFTSWDHVDSLSTTIAILQLIVALITSAYFSIQPLRNLLGIPKVSSRHDLAQKYFTSNFRKLSHHERTFSVALISLTILAKLLESYFFLTLSLREPISRLTSLSGELSCDNIGAVAAFVCGWLPQFLLLLVVLTDCLLFILDTYLWYVIFNVCISICLSSIRGASVWTPWKQAYAQMGERIRSKLLIGADLFSLEPIWNKIVDSLRAEHHISHDQAMKLTIKRKAIAHEKSFFILDDRNPLSDQKQNLEAHRRISFFAQSLSMPLPAPVAVRHMPAFSVLIPHFMEKIFLSLREVIKQENDVSYATLLEYLQKLYAKEWGFFVEDNERIIEDGALSPVLVEKLQNNGSYRIPLRALGFFSSDPRHTNRTRLWCSARAQTLYRTVRGFMNYESALKLLAENETHEEPGDLDSVDQLVARKFRLIVSIQRLCSMTEAQLADVQMLLDLFPAIQIAYIKTEVDINGQQVYYSCLLDKSLRISGAKFRARLKIRLSGDPILGDGKADNQNHALIFFRGEYIQLIDSNQDNYFEECLKIRSILMEFDEYDLPKQPYEVNEHCHPVAIVGAREYIFSEKIGVLGDIAAGKEQTFGTLFARTLAKIGGKLHYGHPDFLNAIFMTTRGGISKGQKGLHVNEDIYAGITVLCRGGNIKHTEYLQCGKGRDLGFVSVMNFVKKIGSGMGEQTLSREYFRLSTSLSVDRFASFYFGHPGFHINNVLIVVCLEMFLIVIIWISSLANAHEFCQLHHSVATGGCQDFDSLILWIRRCVTSIFIVFFLSLLPLFVQETAEKGLKPSLWRITKQLCSLSMIFEIFLSRIYARAFTQNVSLGGAKYLGTGRGFATSRVAFHDLYKNYAADSIYAGVFFFLVLGFSFLNIWEPALLWLWITAVALTASPFIFNPHQFHCVEFFLDYRQLMRWFFRLSANTDDSDSWIDYTRGVRAKITGFRHHTMAWRHQTSRPSLKNLILSQLVTSATTLFVVGLPYVYVETHKVRDRETVSSAHPVTTILVCSALPFALNSVTLIAGAVVSICLAAIAPKRALWVTRAARFVAALVHMVTVFAHLITFWLLYAFVGGSLANALLGTIIVILTQGTFIKAVTLVLPRLDEIEKSNDIWWSGRWTAASLGWRYFTVPVWELLAKVCECSLFTADFLIAHAIIAFQIPILVIPYADQAHSLLLLWFTPSSVAVGEVPTLQKRRRRAIAVRHGFLCVLTLTTLSLTVAMPMMLPKSALNQLALQASVLFRNVPF